MNGCREVYSYTPSRPFCDVAYQSCRPQVIRLIDNEPSNGTIDVAFWFMEDPRFSNALVRAKNRGVRVRVMFDTDALVGTGSHITIRKDIIAQLANAGIPLRHKSTGGILHWKMMTFGEQKITVFSGANFSPDGYVPWDQYVNYEDEVIVFTADSSLVNSFKSKYDDVWTSTSGYENYANVTTLERYHGLPVTQDARLNFPPTQNYATRAQRAYDSEVATRAGCRPPECGIDVTIYRITQASHADAMIRAVQRGVPVRLYTEQHQYRDVSRLWHSYNVDRMYMANRDSNYNCLSTCIDIKDRAHEGLNHQKSVILHGQRTVIFGSSNWTSPSASSQLEHNIFTNESLYYDFFVNQFDRKWENRVVGKPETKPFVPLAPAERPAYKAPAAGATGQNAAGVVLRWWSGPWAHKYDVYLGTTPTLSSANLIAVDLELGPSESSGDYQTLTTAPLQPGTTYYWQVVSKTMANKTRTGEVWSFTTAGTPAPGSGDLPSGWATTDIGAVGAAGSATYTGATQVYTVSGSGADIWGSADEFRFVYTNLVGDGSITARVATLSNENAWTKAGVMMREGFTAGAKHASMFVSSAKGLAFQRRASANGTSSSTAGAFAGDPYWVRMSRSGTTFTAEVSPDGSNWTIVGSQPITMNSTIQVGLALTSHLDGTLSTATLDNVQVRAGTTTTPEPTETAPLPTGWTTANVGAASPTGSASFDSATNAFSVRGAGADIWGTADAFYYAYTDLDGDGEIVAKVDAVQNVDLWTKAGVMIRDGLTAGAAHATMLISPTTTKGAAFQRRPTANGTTVSTGLPSVQPPYWVKLVRVGTSFTASASPDGNTWTVVGTHDIPMGTVVNVGLVVSSHRNGTLATAKFSSVNVTD